MHTITNLTHDECPAPSRPSTEHASAKGGSSIRRTPLLPPGWAPLTVDQQRAVLQACDSASSRLALRLGSLVDAAVDFRVYQLQNESWAGLCVASRCFTDYDGVVSNRDLLGLGADVLRTVRIALDFYNSDLQARGETWRLQAEVPAVPQGDPGRV